MAKVLNGVKDRGKFQTAEYGTRALKTDRQIDGFVIVSTQT